jgi:hypothetical protein
MVLSRTEEWALRRYAEYAARPPGFLAGTAFGAIVRQLTQLRVAAAAARVLSQIIDQDRVQRLLRGPSDRA